MVQKFVCNALYANTTVPHTTFLQAGLGFIRLLSRGMGGKVLGCVELSPENDMTSTLGLLHKLVYVS